MRRLFVLVLLLVLVLVPAAPAPAHIVPTGVGMQLYLKIQPRKVVVEYNLGFSDFAGYAEVLKMEADRDNVLEKEEIDAWLDAQRGKLAAGLEIVLDGKRLGLKFLEHKSFALFAGTKVNEVSGAPFDTWWTWEAEADLAKGEHTFEIRDRNYEREDRMPILWFPKSPMGFRTYAFEPDPKEARYLDAGTDYQLFAAAATLFVEFNPEAASPPAAAPGAAPVVASTGTTSGDATSDGMRKYAEKSAADAAAKTGRPIEYRGAEETQEGRALVELRDKTWYVALALALLWGAAHALAPGHGKSMVAAYLLGTEGRVRDAVSLGAIVTITHTASIFVLAVLVFYLAEHVFGVNPNTAAGRAAIAMEIAAGVIVFLMGVGILYRRLQGIDDHGHSHGPGGHHHHGHDHEHEHGHGHGHESEKENEPGKGVLALGFAAGFQPCTAGIALVFMSLAQGWLWKGIYLLIAFSLGLGLVIISIATAMVTMKSMLKEKIEPEGRFIRALPALSAAALTAVGAWMVIDVLMRNKIGPFAHT